jgi:tRNA dimethylallyltransferase
MESGTDAQGALNLNPSNVRPENDEEKPKLVVIMGPTGSGKSRLAVDLASHFPIEIINADSMQVYQGLDVLTNKVPLHEQKGHYSLSLSCMLFRCVCVCLCVKFTFG